MSLDAVEAWLGIFTTQHALAEDLIVSLDFYVIA